VATVAVEPDFEATVFLASADCFDVVDVGGTVVVFAIVVSCCDAFWSFVVMVVEAAEFEFVEDFVFSFEKRYGRQPLGSGSGT